MRKHPLTLSQSEIKAVLSIYDSHNAIIQKWRNKGLNILQLFLIHPFFLKTVRFAKIISFENICLFQVKSNMEFHKARKTLP